jgi:glycosyltransferase involved in cell wall biosynthesis
MKVSRQQLTVIAPVFNEEEVIREFYSQVRAVLAGLADRYECRILFVVDRGTDRSMEQLREIAAEDPSAQVLSLSSRFGHQMSLLAGLDAAKDADVLVMMDCDLQHPPTVIPELIHQYEHGFDVVNTERLRADDTHVLRSTLGRLFYRLLDSLSSTPIHVDAADFRLISARVARVMREEIRERNMFLRGLFSWVGFNQTSIDFTANPRLAGSSKYSFSRMMGLATAGILSFSTKPLHLGIFVGIGLALLSFIIGIGTLISYFRDSEIPSGFTTIVILMVLFSGVQLLFMGIIGAYIGGIHDEVKARPHYIVDEAINLE